MRVILYRQMDKKWKKNTSNDDIIIDINLNCPQPRELDANEIIIGYGSLSKPEAFILDIVCSGTVVMYLWVDFCFINLFYIQLNIPRFIFTLYLLLCLIYCLYCGLCLLLMWHIAVRTSQSMRPCSVRNRSGFSFNCQTSAFSVHLARCVDVNQ